jgi:hypothetical protein
VTPTTTRSTAARDTLLFIDAFRPIQGEVTALANRVRFTTASRKVLLAADALQIRRGGRCAAAGKPLPAPAWAGEEQPRG